MSRVTTTGHDDFCLAFRCQNRFYNVGNLQSFSTLSEPLWSSNFTAYYQLKSSNSKQVALKKPDAIRYFLADKVWACHLQFILIAAVNYWLSVFTCWAHSALSQYPNYAIKRPCWRVAAMKLTDTAILQTRGDNHRQWSVVVTQALCVGRRQPIRDEYWGQLTNERAASRQWPGARFT